MKCHFDRNYVRFLFCEPTPTPNSTLKEVGRKENLLISLNCFSTYFVGKIYLFISEGVTSMENLISYEKSQYIYTKNAKKLKSGQIHSVLKNPWPTSIPLHGFIICRVQLNV